MSRTSRCGFTLVELLVVIAIIGILIALLLPAVQAAREAARRGQCANNLKQIGLAVSEYEETHNVYPPGCIVTIPSGGPAWTVWDEAGSGSGNGRHGTSWLLQILPFLEQENLYDKWNFNTNVNGNFDRANTDVAGYYCPSRRNRVRPGDERLFLNLSGKTWKEGGTDYGGCLGGGKGFESSSRQHPFFDSSDKTDDYFYIKRKGFFQPNKSTRHMQLRDGTTNTIMAGEMQRLWDPAGDNAKRSQDGWAVGGVATLFTTNREEPISGGVKPTMNNEFFESPGSDHNDGANFCMGDGSVHFINEFIDETLFYYLGSIDDDESVALPAK